MELSDKSIPIEERLDFLCDRDLNEMVLWERETDIPENIKYGFSLEFINEAIDYILASKTYIKLSIRYKLLNIIEDKNLIPHKMDGFLEKIVNNLDNNFFPRLSSKDFFKELKLETYQLLLQKYKKSIESDEVRIWSTHSKEFHNQRYIEFRDKIRSILSTRNTDKERLAALLID